MTQREAAVDLLTKGRKGDHLFRRWLTAVVNTCSPKSQPADKEEPLCLFFRVPSSGSAYPLPGFPVRKECCSQCRPRRLQRPASAELAAFPGGGWEEVVGLLLSARGALVCDTPLRVRLELCRETVLPTQAGSLIASVSFLLGKTHWKAEVYRAYYHRKCSHFFSKGKML